MQKARLGLAIITILLLLMYVPIILNSPKGWILYAYWTLIAVIALAFGASVKWGENYG
jgi:hypothetical protein